MRQTNLTLEQLLNRLESPMGMPRCLIINEIGEILLEEKNKKAERILAQIYFLFQIRLVHIAYDRSLCGKF